MRWHSWSTIYRQRVRRLSYHGGLCRWADALLRVFGADKVVETNWIKSTLVDVRPQPTWEAIKQKFVDEFTRAHDAFEEVRPVIPTGPSELRQRNSTVATHLAEFERRIQTSFRGPAPSDWHKTHGVYTLLFINSLRPALRSALVKDKKFRHASETGLRETANLASEV